MSKESAPLISSDLLQSEFQKYQDRSISSATFSDKDKRLIATFSFYIRRNIIKQKRELILDEYVFTTLAQYLCTTPTISYNEFRDIAGVAPPAAQKYFTAQSFLKFPRDEHQNINSEDFARFIERSIEIETTILSLMDAVPPRTDALLTFLDEGQLGCFISKMIPKIDIFQAMPEPFYEFYVCTAAQKFFFFQDPRMTNSVSIKKLAHSKEMEELLSIRKLALQVANSTMSMQEAETELNKNWFSYYNAARIYSLFCDLDKDQNGFVSMEEVADFAGLNSRHRVNFTRVAWERIFEEYILFTPAELDYAGFVRLILALENPTSPASIRYFWRVLDLDQSGRLTPMKIKYFYGDIYASLLGGYEVPSAEHVVIEVFDLLACNSTEGATLNDFLTSKQGHTVISMLLDVNGFWRYDNRESLMGSEEEEEVPPSLTLDILPPDSADALDALVGDSSVGDVSAGAGFRVEVQDNTRIRDLDISQDSAESVEEVLDSKNAGISRSGNGAGVTCAAGTAGAVSASAKSRLLSQIDDQDGDKEESGYGEYNDSFDAYDDELFSDEEMKGAVEAY